MIQRVLGQDDPGYINAMNLTAIAWFARIGR